jgi:uncharacterized protein YcbK (DUF882 family)
MPSFSEENIKGNSYHCIGLAADIQVKDINLIELLERYENI